VNKIVRVNEGFDFQKELEASKNRLAYYEEGLRVETATRILDAMEHRSVSRSELARRLDVSPAYITKILRGNANLSLDSLAKLAFALDLKWDLILMPPIWSSRRIRSR
jgi:ribosome-binding protein aMBF1 (putative translation factor)